MYQDFRDKNQVFQGMFCRFSTSLSLTYEGRTELIQGELVSGNYFPVLGVGAALGRVFTAQDDLIQGGHPIAVLSYGYWKTRFAADPSVIGRKIVVNGYPLTVVGVSREGFDGRRGARLLAATPRPDDNEAPAHRPVLRSPQPPPPFCASLRTPQGRSHPATSQGRITAALSPDSPDESAREGFRPHHRSE